MISSPPVPVQAPAPAHGRLTRRRFLTLSAAAAGGLGLYAGEIERHEIDVVERTIPLAGLPEAFAGFRIAQLSDIHLEEYTEATFLKIVIDRMNALRADLVVLTGDFISNSPLPHRFSIRWSYRCAELLSKLTCKLRFAILGNHDAMVDAAAVTDALVTHRIPVLSNRYVALERGGQRVWLAGLADAIAGQPDLSPAIPRRRDAAREPLILLVHEPDYADLAVGRQVALILSGHTHGGQIRIPFLPPIHLPVLGRKYLEGLFTLGDGMRLYVNRGIGTVGVPFRFRCPPEITVITLVPADRGAQQRAPISPIS